MSLNIFCRQMSRLLNAWYSRTPQGVPNSSGHLRSLLLTAELGLAPSGRCHSSAPTNTPKRSGAVGSPNVLRNRHGNLTELPKLNEHVLFSGNMHRPSLSAKAMQSRYLFFFLQELMAEHVGTLSEKCTRAPALHASAVSLRRVYSAILEAGPRMDRPQYCVEQMLGHLKMYQRAKCLCAPKHHIALEMMRRQGETGNVRFISEYPDPSICIARTAAIGTRPHDT